MKVLLDECVPRPIKISFSVEGHECSTVTEAGFAGKSNGELLRLAESRFEVFVTLDKGMRFQQNLSDCRLAIVMICVKSSRVEDVLPHIPACLMALRSITPGTIVHVGESR
ncbi:MAG TPA: DUF5615 family PIN-like protein [Candidatus Acidoferrales bacterium]|jgi:hypothetical protein|nr:DUF5615 family PIN-like protein [Candidatus Acidoferrales bacterium]